MKVYKNRACQLMLILFLLAACEDKLAVTDAVDYSAIKTEAVQTAVAEMTVQAILNPSPTPVVETMTPGVDAELSAEESLELPPTVEATQAPSPTPFIPVYQCETDPNKSLPADAPQPAGAEIEKAWFVTNTGNVTWTDENVNIKWVGGVNFCPADQTALPGTVNPGESVKITVDLSMPAEPVDKHQITEWGLVNDDNEIFCKLYFQIPFVY